jgi:hypothetical protein
VLDDARLAVDIWDGGGDAGLGEGEGYGLGRGGTVVVVPSDGPFESEGEGEAGMVVRRIVSVVRSWVVELVWVGVGVVSTVVVEVTMGAASTVPVLFSLL